MDVHLLVYDLSHGLARRMSMAMLGFQLDAVYHTSILIEGLEYVYQQSIRVITPGSFSGLGHPIERICLGRTELPHEVIIDYLNSVQDRFTPQAYDLFAHNCNTFTDEFSNFLLGKGIPDHITNMPQAVLGTPFGAMLQRQISEMAPIGDPVPQTSVPSRVRTGSTESASGTVKLAQNTAELESLLTSVRETCAVVFFTSATCPPCKMLYPLYKELATELSNKGTLIKVDVSQARDVALQYSVGVTPTFITFLKGSQQERWSGADGERLKRAVHQLVRTAQPPHPHQSLRLPALFAQSTDPKSYSKTPPLSKLVSKLGSLSSDPAVLAAKDVFESQAGNSHASINESTISSFSGFIERALVELPVGRLFAAIDLFRCVLVKPEAANVILSRHARTIHRILTFVNSQDDCPYALRLVTLHMACNLGKSALFPEKVLRDSSLRQQLIQLIITSLLQEEHDNIRVSAAALFLNVALVNSKPRRDSNQDILSQDDQLELGASVLEAISREVSSAEALRGLLLGFGLLIYLLPLGAEVVDFLIALHANGTVLAKKDIFPKEPLIPEIAQLVEKLISD